MKYKFKKIRPPKLNARSAKDNTMFGALAFDAN
jgi:hypothetical protein